MIFILYFSSLSRCKHDPTAHWTFVGELRRHIGAEGSQEETGVQVVQVVPGQRLPGTLHSGRGGRLWRGKTTPHSSFERFF